MIYKSEEELMYKARSAEGKTFGQIDKSGRIENPKAKGQLGQIVEESYFGYEVNSRAEADFENLGIELKVTPIRKNKSGTISAKERLALNIINYNSEVLAQFENSSFWMKNQEILMMFYEWLPEINRADYKIIKSYLHKYPEEDLEIIKQDWKLIVEKVKEGLAHELSEADTNYLAASTKGANKSSLRTQPFSDEMAMQRAFSLKQSYMTALVRKVIKQEELVQFTTATKLKEKTLIQLLEEKFEPYVGDSLDKISQKAGIPVNYNMKSYLPGFISSLLGIRGTKLNQIEEFAKANIQFKTVKFGPNGLPEEHMSFKNVDLNKWATDEWEESWLKNHFEETKFLLVIFHYKETKRQNPNRKLYFSGIKMWNLPSQEVEGRLKEFWFDVKTLINDGIELTPVQQKSRTIVQNNLPKAGSNGLCHLRPKGTATHKYATLPDGRQITKQSFWFDKELIAEICKSF